MAALGGEVVSVPPEDCCASPKVQAVHHAGSRPWPGIPHREPFARCRAYRSAGTSLLQHRGGVSPTRYTARCSGGRLSHTSTAAPALVIHRRRLDGEAFVAAPSAPTHGPLRRPALRRSRAATSHEARSRSRDNPSSPNWRAAPRNITAWPQEPLPGPLGSAAPVANSCNSACVGCLSWQPSTPAPPRTTDTLCADRDHVVDVALPFCPPYRKPS